MGQFCYCSLSPQGDDNSAMTTPARTGAVIAAYPRKGTIIERVKNVINREKIAAYPRKGTIMPMSRSISSRMDIAAYPRKGTITQDEQSNQEHFDCSLSPQGDDNRRRLQ